jgi:hypothetical protein
MVKNVVFLWVNNSDVSKDRYNAAFHLQGKVE